MAIYKLAFPSLVVAANKNSIPPPEVNDKHFKSDVIFEEIRDRATKV